MILCERCGGVLPEEQVTNVHDYPIACINVLQVALRSARTEGRQAKVEGRWAMYHELVPDYLPERLDDATSCIKDTASEFAIRILRARSQFEPVG